MPLRIEQLPAALERGIAPVYLFGGAEPLLLQECRDQVLAAARSAGFTGRDIVHAERGFDWETLAQLAGAPSLFAERKLVDLRLPSGKPGRDGARILSEWAATPDPDTVLMVSCDNWDAGSRKSKWAGQLEKAGLRVDIWPVGPRELPAWINRRMQAAGLQPEREAVMILADRLEGNLLAAQQEIEKLALLKGAGPVSADDVLQSVADSSRFDAFLLVERILAGDLAGALRVALGLRRTDVAIQLVTGAVVRELRTLEVFKAACRSGESEVAVFRKLNIWKSRQGPMREAAVRIEDERLQAAFRTLAIIDRQSKGQAGGDPWHELDRLVRSLCA